MHRNAVQIRVRHAQNCDMVLRRQSQFQAWLVLSAEMKEFTDTSWTFWYYKLVIPAPWASIFSKINLSTPPIWVVFFCQDGLLPRHLKLQNDGTRKHLKFGHWSRSAELGKNEGLFSVSSVYLQGPVSIYLGWVHPLRGAIFHTSGIKDHPIGTPIYRYYA